MTPAKRAGEMPAKSTSNRLSVGLYSLCVNPPFARKVTVLTLPLAAIFRSVSCEAAAAAVAHAVPIGPNMGNGRLDLIQALAANAASVGDFSLDQPQHQKAKIQIPLGTTGVFTFSIVALQGFTGTVDFSVRGLPSNIFGSFDPPTITGSGSVALTLQVDSAAQPGKYKLLITGASGTLLHSIDLDLHVQQ